MLPLRRNIRKEGAGTWLQRKSAPIADIIIDSRFLDRNRCLNLRADVRIDHKFKVYQNLFTMTTFSPSLIIKTFNIWLDLNLTGYIAHFDVEIMINPALLIAVHTPSEWPSKGAGSSAKSYPQRCHWRDL